VDTKKYQVIFDKMAVTPGSSVIKIDSKVESTLEEMEAINELRKLSLEISQPVPASYTKT
jgi:hypothetical protein